MLDIEENPRERALLVGVELPNQEWPISSSLEELARLVDSAGADAVAICTQKLSSPNPRTFIGSGKVREVSELANEYECDLIIFDDELTPTQQSNLEKSVDRSIKVIDRTALILDIFALHATTKEGRLQVRLAQNQYLYPRLRGMWAHLASNRMGGGVGSRFGEGESQLEVDRRMVRKRITSIKRELKHLESVRALQRESRYGSSVFNVALAGYTNAGKSSLLNKLTDADVLSYDKLFATLDSTTRRYKLPEGREITVTDTVGFIRKLPTTLIEAFKSTLDEINGSDLIIHVIDASSDERAYQIEAVETVLGQIGAETIPRIEVFNKCDLLDEQTINAYRKRYPQALFISALNGSGFGDLITAITSTAASQDTLMNVVIPYKDSAMTALAHKRCNIVSESYEPEGTALTLYVAHNLVGRFEPYIQT